MDIVELIDSDDENLPKCQALNDSNVKDEDSDLSDFDLQFPKLDWNAINYVPSEKSNQRKRSVIKDSCESVKAQKHSPSKIIASAKDKQSSVANTRRTSESDSDYESQFQNDYLAKNINNIEADNIVLSDDDEQQTETNNNAKGKGKKTGTKPKKIDEEKKRKQEEKKRKQEEKQQERLRKKEEAARLKAEKQLNSKNRLVIKADYSMKMMTIIIDNPIQSLDFFTNFINAVEETQTKYRAESQAIPKSITWKRTVEDHYINNENEVCSSTRIVDEDHVLVIWDCEETIMRMANDTFISELSDMKSQIPGKNLFLVIYKVETYFNYLKNAKDRTIRNDILGQEKKKYKSKSEKVLASLPEISRMKFEEFLVDIQLDLNVTNRLIETPEEMALLIHQYTRSLALLPSKLEKRQDAAKFDWFVSSDSRDTVKVDKDGNGLKRLWQQQLCQFTLMSLESAEAITSVYKSPLQLMEAYANCTPAEGEVLLRDIPIRRAAGPLTSTRRIGPELSKKLYIMFTSKDGNIHLNE